MALVFALAMKTTTLIKSRKAGAKAPTLSGFFAGLKPCASTQKAEALRFRPGTLKPCASTQDS
jgi:hypothetical protein